MADRPSQKALADLVSEAQETIEAIGKHLLGVEAARDGGDPDPALVNALFRAAHSLKGLAGMFGIERMGRLAHALEDLLEAIRLGRLPLDATTLDLLLETPEVLSRIIAEEAMGAPLVSAEPAERLAARLRAAGAAARALADDSLVTVELDPSVRDILTEHEEHRLRASLASGMTLYRLDVSFELATFDLGLAELNARLRPIGEVVSTLPSSTPGEPTIIAFELLFGSREPLDRVRDAAGPSAAVHCIRRGSVATVPPAPPDLSGAPERPDQPSPVRDASPPGEPTDSIRSVSQAVRVDIRKLDRLMNVVGELLLVKTSLMRLAERVKLGEHGPALAAELQRENRSLDRKLNALQAGILEVRMVPLGQVFDKLARMVRKIARDLGKEIDFRVSGGDVELDKLIVEDLSDPLMHLLRNAVDHAIEPPDVRLRHGKSRAGRISLSAEQKGTHVVIAVEDDGTGIDEGRVREVAVHRGLASPKVVQDLSRREALNLIFMPGFSTARQVTTLSGRGVGMDVVKNNIGNLSGIIDLHSDWGQGTRFELTLPVTLAIVRALVVAVAGRTYAVPLNTVLEILSVDPSEVRTIDTREVVTVRETTLPLVRLARLFGLSSAERPTTGRLRTKLFVVVVGLAQERLGIVIDEVVGQQDIVVKPLGPALAGVRGIAGATDLGSRRAVLVLDVGAIIDEVASAEVRREAAG